METNTDVIILLCSLAFYLLFHWIIDRKRTLKYNIMEPELQQFTKLDDWEGKIVESILKIIGIDASKKLKNNFISCLVLVLFAIIHLFPLYMPLTIYYLWIR